MFFYFSMVNILICNLKVIRVICFLFFRKKWKHGNDKASI